ncbi:hypothetical protein Q4595_24260, partial [Wenyingzhuangia sp. 1_MG-2023]|nr:hypothetical protein [Wenyingzhuangia sp. 1_MG-2023]
VERIGIQRAWDEIRQADRILLMMDATSDQHSPEQLLHALYDEQGLATETDALIRSGRLTVIRNKIDLANETAGLDNQGPFPVLRISARQQLGIDALRQHLKQ